MQPTAVRRSAYRSDAGRCEGAASDRPDATYYVLTLAVAVALFVCDWNTELGVAVGVAYVIAIWAADSTGNTKFVWGTAVVCSLLVILGFLKSPPGGETWKVLANRSLSLLAIWTTAVFVQQRRQANAAQTELNRRLVESNEALTQSNIDLQQFAYVASHDLQSPLRHISGFVQLLQREYGDKLDKNAEEWIGYTVDGVERMQVLIRDLLTFSRVESKSKPFADVSLDDVVDHIIEIFADEEATITRDELPVVAGDKSQLLHLMQNLIGNGIKYHSDEPACVHISATQTDNEWLISVQDNGIGIDPKHHKKVFEVFRRLHTSQEYPGTGIGLAVCRRIAKRHGGKIWIESEAGAGATFCFTIPIHEATS